MTPRQTEVRVRPMTAADILWAKALADSTPEAPHWPSAAYEKALDPASYPRRVAMVAETPAPASGLPSPAARSGFAIASLVPPQAELEAIVVATASRRLGIARTLFERLTSSLKAANITEVTLEVRASNMPALAFYHSIGFRESGRRVRYYVDPVEDAVLMVRGTQ